VQARCDEGSSDRGACFEHRAKTDQPGRRAGPHETPWPGVRRVGIGLALVSPWAMARQELRLPSVRVQHALDSMPQRNSSRRGLNWYPNRLGLNLPARERRPSTAPAGTYGCRALGSAMGLGEPPSPAASSSQATPPHQHARRAAALASAPNCPSEPVAAARRRLRAPWRSAGPSAQPTRPHGRWPPAGR
jgi:hypothetical protein